jgi:hypothetical protein
VSGPAGASRAGGFTPLDRLTLAYVAIPTLALALSFGDGPITGWPYVLLAQALTVACVLIAPRARGAGPVGRVVGDLYPLLLLPALYGEIGIFTLHRGVVHDALIQDLELRMFGTHVSVDWIRAMPNAALSWVMHLSYLAYYPILAAPPLVFWATGRREAPAPPCSRSWRPSTSTTPSSSSSRWRGRGTSSRWPPTPRPRCGPPGSPSRC